MPTRLYLSTLTPPITPAVDSDFEESSLVHRAAATTDSSLFDATRDGILFTGTGVANEDTVGFQLVYGPLTEQTISGTVKAYLGAREASVSTDARAQFNVRVLAADGVTVRGTAYALSSSAVSSEFNMSSSVRLNRRWPLAADSNTLTPVIAQTGDYLVIGFGFRNHGTNTGAVRFGFGIGSTDAPEDETTNFAAYRGWIEFSMDIAVLGYAPSVVPIGHLHIGKFVVAEPLYTIENEIVSHDEVDEGRLRTNVVLVDGEDDPWTEYDRTDLVARDSAVNLYLDLPELKTQGEVRQRALEEIQQARATSSPGGEISGPLVLTTNRMDPIFWIDSNGNKYQTRIEGKSVSFNCSRTPFQRATIDTGAIIFCPPGEDVGTLIARDTFERDDSTGLGDAELGGNWVIYT